MFIMLEITPTFSIDERELHFDFVRSAGPGGQNVNKVATAVQLRFNIRASALPEEAKTRLISLSGQRITNEDELLIEARRFRTQEQNREDAVRRLIDLLRRALIPPKPRKKTRPSSASRARRVKEKKQKGVIKRMRQTKSFETE